MKKTFRVQNKPKKGQTTNFMLQNQHLTLIFDSNGNLLSTENSDQGLKSNVVQNFCYYKSVVGDNSNPDRQASGAYVFRPDGPDICFGVREFSIVSGQQFQEIRQVYNDWISQTIRLYNDAQYAEFEWQVGPINVEDTVGKEVVVKFSSDLQSNSTFYTDANGREILKRVRDYRATWPFNNTEPVAGNYYPVNSRIFIRDEAPSVLNRQLTIVTDRTHGGSSIEDGSMELMLHRRVLNDDALGVTEPLNEPGSDGKGLIARGKYYVFFNTTQHSVRLHRSFAHEINTQSIPMFLIGKSQELAKLKNIKDLGFFTDSLPDNVHLLTLMYDFDNEAGDSLIIRLEHFYEIV
jgi:lysosomal alpha-mannosidase